MKITVNVDVTPEEMRRFMGLPDVADIQQQMMDAYAENLQNSQEQQADFVRSMINGSMAPWQSFFTLMGQASINDSEKKGG